MCVKIALDGLKTLNKGNMNIQLVLIVIAVVFTVGFFQYLSVRKSAISECEKFCTKIFEGSLRGSVNATDQYKHIHYLTKRFWISAQRLGYSNFGIIANEAFNSLSIYIAKAKHECLPGIGELELKAKIFRKEFFEDTSHSKSDEAAIKQWLTNQ